MISRFIIPCIGILYALYMVFMIPSNTTLTCIRDRRFDRCKIIESRLGVSKSVKFPLNILRGAKVNENDGGFDYNTTYEIILLTTSGEVRFTNYDINDQSEAQAVMSRINNFVTNPQQTSLREKQDNRLIVFSLAIIAIVCALLAIFLGWGV
jgi:hypothetical protein